MRDSSSQFAVEAIGSSARWRRDVDAVARRCFHQQSNLLVGGGTWRFVRPQFAADLAEESIHSARYREHQHPHRPIGRIVEGVQNALRRVEPAAGIQVEFPGLGHELERPIQYIPTESLPGIRVRRRPIAWGNSDLDCGEGAVRLIGCGEHAYAVAKSVELLSLIVLDNCVDHHLRSFLRDGRSTFETVA